MPRQVIINWGISSFFGWGVYGLNLALQWAADPELAAACPFPIRDEEVALDPLRRRALLPFGRRSAELQKHLLAMPPGETVAETPLLMGLHHAFNPDNARPDLVLTGRPTIGVTFFQETQLAPDAVARAASYPAMVAGSTWNAEIMRAHGLANVRTILQGIDPTLFHPAPRQGLFPDRFLVFSGGKLERRKGQDIVLAAFRRFAERRPDALLVTAWHGPWAADTTGLDQSGLAAPVPKTADGGVDVPGWASTSGLRRDQVLDLGAIPNAQLPPVLREMDVALFANRGEGGTNLVAMEAMACGVPTILSANTGHLDLIEEGNCLPLETQRPLEGLEGPVNGVPGWGESDVDEVVDALERAYVDREAARRIGAAGARTLSRLTWAKTAAEMKALVLEFS